MATAKGLINGITMDPDGNPTPNDALSNVLPTASHAGHAIEITSANGKLLPKTATKEDVKISEEAAATGHGAAKKCDPIGLLALAIGVDPVEAFAINVV